MPRQGNKGKSSSGSKSVKLGPGFPPSLDRIVETMLGPLNLGPGGGSYNEPISRLHCPFACTLTTPLHHLTSIAPVLPRHWLSTLRPNQSHGPQRFSGISM